MNRINWKLKKRPKKTEITKSHESVKNDSKQGSDPKEGTINSRDQKDCVKCTDEYSDFTPEQANCQNENLVNYNSCEIFTVHSETIFER